MIRLNLSESAKGLDIFPFGLFKSSSIGVAFDFRLWRLEAFFPEGFSPFPKSSSFRSGWGCFSRKKSKISRRRTCTSRVLLQSLTRGAKPSSLSHTSFPKEEMTWSRRIFRRGSIHSRFNNLRSAKQSRNIGIKDVRGQSGLFANDSMSLTCAALSRRSAPG